MSKLTYQEPTSFVVNLEMIKDEENPRSLINLLPLWIGNLVRAIPNHLFELSIDELREKVQPNDELLRLNFWLEYDRAQRSKMNINLSNIYKGVCYQASFNKVVQNSFRLLYILTPPIDYETKMHHLLHMALDQEAEILRLPHFNDKGEVLDRVVATKVKIRESLQNRLQGMPLVRSTQLNYNKNVNLSGPEAPIPGGAVDTSEMSAEALEAEIERLKRNKGVIDTPKNNSTTIAKDEHEVIDVTVSKD